MTLAALLQERRPRRFGTTEPTGPPVRRPRRQAQADSERPSESEQT